MNTEPMRREAVVRAKGADVVLRPEGIFDVPAAWRLRESLRMLPQGCQVTIDFSGLRECHDFALAGLLQAVASAQGPRLSVRGLCHHQERLLRYLGVNASPAPATFAASHNAEHAQ
jgi:hypothetical protein